ncbi:TetR/AcrR family transcriptional regulator [Actinoplanes sp. CA-142083]|uniref:TetR/AcrR family transcriptional regulator n=1 Tax=Actinoplanes sp. CA-142083 TaxID=3239903 RepID=UPI003D914094
MDLLWGSPAPRSRGPRPVLSVEQIASAAVEIADAEGLAAVTMKRVADRFGFTAMSLYRYVPGRSELVSLMIDAALGQAPPISEAPSAGRRDGAGDEGEGWQPALIGWATDLYAVFHRHPWLATATMEARPIGPKELSWLEAAVGVLATTRLTGPERVDAALVIIGHIRSQVQAEAGIAAGEGARLAGELRGMLREHAGDFPALAEAAGEGAFGPNDNDGFAFGLRCIVGGLDAT